MPEKEYSVSNFYCGSKDKQGHSRVVRINPSSYGPVSELLADPSNPYKTYDDFARDAIVHRWQWLADNTNDPKVKREAKRLKAAAEMDRNKRISDTEDALIRQVSEAVMNPSLRVMTTKDQLLEVLDSLELVHNRNKLQEIISMNFI